MRRSVSFWNVGCVRRHRKSLVICLMLVWLLVVFHLYSLSEQSQTSETSELRFPGLLNSDGDTHDRWIVVTTINPPSRALQRLADIPDWKMVVVGDHKSPRLWRMPNVVYLDIEKQKRLGYQITKHLPDNSYTRKNIGYLYAIQHGARYIYETDDDNMPNDSLQGFIYNATFNGLHLISNAITYNPFVHFGPRGLWPRGYPLEYINSHQSRSHCISTDLPRPAVQQGMVDGDPDVDAIYRLINKQQNKEIDVTFDSHAPPVVLDNDVYAPYNSQNTFYHYSAFWSLLLPKTTTFRVCDIWRSYWAQALLKLLNIRVGYLPPNAKQIRNPHSYIKDASEEVDLYTKSGELIQFLQSWNCDRSDFYLCVRELTKAMTRNGFWEEAENDLLNAWLSDLQRLGYHPPTMIDSRQKRQTERCASTLFFSPAIHVGSDPSKHGNFLQRQKHVFDTCGKTANLIKSTSIRQEWTFQSSLLIIIYRGEMSMIPLLETWYRPHFPHILYCSHNDINITTVKMWSGNIMVLDSVQAFTGNELLSCLSMAGKLFDKMTGYFFIYANVFMNLHRINMYNKSDLWISDVKVDGNSMFEYSSQDEYLQRIVNNSQSCFSLLDNIHLPTLKINDFILYIPKHIQKDVLQFDNALRLLSKEKSLNLHSLLFYFLHCLSKKMTFKLMNYFILTKELSNTFQIDSVDYLLINIPNEQSSLGENIRRVLCPNMMLII